MSAPRRKPLDVSFVGLTDKNVEQLRKLNLALFPVRYNDKFYSTDVIKPEHAAVTKLGARTEQRSSHLIQSLRYSRFRISLNLCIEICIVAHPASPQPQSATTT